MLLEFVNPEGLRLDGRRPPELRALAAELGTLARADGSATFHMGNTKVMAAVFGPREVEVRSQTQQDRAVVKCEYAMAPFSTGGERRRRGKTDRRSTELTMVIRETLEENILLELLPRSQIDVYVQVVLLQMDNKMKREDFQQVLKLAQEGCRAVGQFMRGKLLERTQQLANARGAVQL